MSARTFVDAQLRALSEVALAELATVSVVVAPDRDALDTLEDRAVVEGYAVAHASLDEHGLHGLAEVVRALAGSVHLGSARSKKRGLVSALQAFADKHGKRTLDAFDDRARAEGLVGELRRLSRAFLENATGKVSGKRIDAWLAGQAPSDVDAGPGLRTLGPATAKSALGAMTRLFRVLGARGTLFVLDEGEALVDLSPARRDLAYTVLRELIDNADGRGGMVATKLLVAGDSKLVTRRHAIFDHEALATRVMTLEPEAAPTPHATLVRLDEGADLLDRDRTLLPKLSEVPRVPEARVPHLRALLRLAQGLPPLEATTELTVGLDDVDSRIDQLFQTSSHDGSVFAVLVGEYGAGKTHHLLHLEARAVAARRPVMRLAVERLDEDVGNPQRHLRRLLESAIVPTTNDASGTRGRSLGVFAVLEGWLASETTRRKLIEALEALEESDSEVAGHASSCLVDGAIDERALVTMLSALDLVEKPGASSYRRDAYRRLLLWLELLARVEGCEGPVVILDEAENLYRPGVSRSERRTALRSLGFYCGGTIPRACVVLAVTPETLVSLREEAGALLDEIEEQVTALPQEDVAMLRRRLLRARPLEVKKLDAEQRRELAERVRIVHGKVRGKVNDPDWAAWVERAQKESKTPRELLRRAVEHLERLAFVGS
ncbi:MAG: DUF2791 family P-loop domain-containing protein [Deltaproteobacteria bacterium]|nr:DUF2791 family P-loop domain-containing protein [Deltaproteobacteria bacterium]